MTKLMYIIGFTVTMIVGTLPLYFIGHPTILFPSPVYLVLSALSNFYILCSLAIYICCSVLLFTKDPEVFTHRAFIINVILVLGTIIWFFVSWRLGTKHQGATHYYVVLLLNVIYLSGLWWLSSRVERNKILIYSIALPLFLVWLAFPYFGELP